MQACARKPTVDELLGQPAAGAHVLATPLSALTPALVDCGDRFPRYGRLLAVLVQELTNCVLFFEVLIGGIEQGSASHSSAVAA